MTEKLPRILLIDDEENCLRVISDVFALEGIDCITANNGQKGLEFFDRLEIDIVITDVRMPGLTGIEILHQVKKRKPDTIVIMLTGYGSIEEAVEAMKLGAYQYILKPVIVEDLIEQIQEILEKLDSVKNNAPFNHMGSTIPENKQILGSSPRIQNVAKLISKIAGTDLPVLILGESGTGKELAATAIHHSSDRALKKFIAINCAAFPDTLLESELFGYEKKKGAFTDAKTSKPGKIEEAHGGTLFLDEVGDMKPAMQAKLLRVLEEQEFQRLGSNKSQKVNIRVISATNRDLRQAIAEGEFRPDLYYRLNAVNIIMPSLRDISEDIPLFANKFAQQFATRLNRNFAQISNEAITTLLQYKWPGNVRELANAIRRAVALSDGSQVNVYDLPPHITENSQNNDDVQPIKRKSLVLADIEREHILAVLEVAKGNKSLAANMLGIHRDTLLRKLKKYGIS
jgi:two-component system, NtrC family, response regulator AtoC